MEFEVIITKPAIENYYQITDYLLTHFSIKTVFEFDKLLTEKLIFLSIHPLAFTLANKPDKTLRKCIINN